MPPAPAGIMGAPDIVAGGVGLEVGAALSQPDSPSQAVSAAVASSDAAVIRFENGIESFLWENRDK